MFLIKIFHFLKGYVILSLWGQNKEKFLDAVIKNGVKPQYVKRRGDKLLIKLGLKDFFGLRGVNARCCIHIEQKKGLPFLLKRLKKRKLFIAGGCVFLLMFALGSQFIWDIQYEGAEDCDMESLTRAVRLAGLYEGMPKCRIKSGYEMKNIILNNAEDICWAWVYVKGTRVTVSVRKSIIPPQIFDKNVPCDIIAARSGIIKRVIPYNGRAVAVENQAVAPGDTLISGQYEFENEPGYQVHASGIVEAYTEHKKSGVYKQNYCYKKYTGRKRRFVTVKLFKWEVPLYFTEKTRLDECAFSEADYDLSVMGHYTGVGIRVKTATEYTLIKEPISYELTVELARRDLEEQIAGELLSGAEKLSGECFSEKIDEETVRVTVVMNFIEKIGTEKRTEEVDFIEPKTDRVAG